MRVANPADAEAAGGKHHGGVDLLQIHGGQPVFDLGGGLAEGAAEIAVVMLAGNQRCALIAIGLRQIGSNIVVEIPRMGVGIQNFYRVT